MSVTKVNRNERVDETKPKRCPLLLVEQKNYTHLNIQIKYFNKLITNYRLILSQELGFL